MHGWQRRAGRVLAAAAVLAALASAFAAGRRWPFEGLEQRLGLRREPPAPPWTVFAAADIPRYEVLRVVAGGRLLVMGGFSSARPAATARVDALDLATRTWQRKGDMPEPLTHTIAVLRGDTVWIAGGFVGDHPGPATDRVWRYVPASDAWIPGPPLPAPRGGGGLALIGDTLHFAGGWLPDRRTDSRDHWVLGPGDTAWRARAPLPRPRGHASMAVTGGALYLLGGSVGHDPTPIDVDWVDRYDPATDTWSVRPPLPLALSHAEPGTVVWRDAILIAGGRSRPAARGAVDDIHRYDPATGRSDLIGRLPAPPLGALMIAVGDTLVAGLGATGAAVPQGTTLWTAPIVGAWHRGPDMPVPLGEVSAAHIGGKLFVVGEGPGVTLALDLATGTWEGAHAWPGRPAPGNHHGAEVMDGKLVLIGGMNWDTGGLLQIFDPRTRTWSAGPPLPFATGSAATAVIGGRLYVAGGVVAHRTTTRAAVLDALGGAWRDIAPMPRGRNHAAAATDGERLFVFGGRGPGSGDGNVLANGFDDVQIYDPRSDTWRVSDGSPGAPAPLPQARGGLGKAVFVDGEFWVLGGETLDGAGATRARTYDRVDIYDSRTNRWRAGPPLSVARHGIFPVLVDGAIVVAGGGTAAGYSASAVTELLRLR